MKLKNLGITVAVTGFLVTVSQATHAQTALQNNGLQFKQDTIIEFEFIQSEGAYQSTFGVVDLDSCQSSWSTVDLSTCQKTPLLAEVKASDYPVEDSKNQAQGFLGTPGNTVLQPMAEFLFKANKRYAFYLESYFNGKPAGIKYSSAIYNPNNSQHAVFVDNLSPEVLQARRRNADQIKLDPQLEEELGALVHGGILIRWEDTSSVLVSQEQAGIDFDDFIIAVGGELDCY